MVTTNIYIFLGLFFLLTFIIGRLTEKIRVPWIFSALLIGATLSFFNPFENITSSDTFSFLAQLGMYFLLFIIGYDINVDKLKQNSKFIIKATFFLVFFEAIFGTLLVHFIFKSDWFISFIVSLSFATVGEAVLVPILQEFKLINTKLGQSIIGIGTFDDIIEVALLIVVVFVVGKNTGIPSAHIDSIIIPVIILFLFLFTYGLTRLKHNGEKFSFIKIQILLILILFIFFIFLGFGEYAHATALAAFLSGIAIKSFIPRKELESIENDLKVLCYGFFAPLFFLWVGLGMDISYLIAFPGLILLVVLVSNSAKIVGSYIIGKKELGAKQSILLGIGLSVRLSTSIIIVKILYENSLIGLELYSIIIASSIIFTFVVPLLFSTLLVRWKVAKVGKRKEKS